MKKFAILAFAFIAFLLSCTKDKCEMPPKPEEKPVPKLIVGKGVISPGDRTQKVFTNKNTKDTLFDGWMKAENADIWVEQIPITVETSWGYLDEVIDNLILSINDVQYQESVPYSAGSSWEFEFDDLHTKIKKDDSVYVVLIANISRVGDDYHEGTTLSGRISAAQAKDIEAEDRDANDLNESQISGEIIGGVLTLRSIILSVLIKSISLSQGFDASGVLNRGIYNLNLKVTSFGKDVYMPKALWRGYYSENKSAFSFTFEEKSSPNVAVVGGSFQVYSFISTSGAAVAANSLSWELQDSQTEYFNLTISFMPPKNGHYSMTLRQLQVFLKESLIGETIVTELIPNNTYRTGYIEINK